MADAASFYVYPENAEMRAPGERRIQHAKPETASLTPTAFRRTVTFWKKADMFKAGEKIRKSGIYSVLHDGKHSEAHDVTCVAGRTFPACEKCGDLVQFVLVRHARHVDRDDNFRA
jgi:hypothetical protein